MNKTIKRITAMASAVVITICCMAATASAQSAKCSCGKTTATLNVASTSATATTITNGSSRSMSVSINGVYWDKVTGKLKTIENQSSGISKITISIFNGSGLWESVSSTHTSCCGDIVLNW